MVATRSVDLTGVGDAPQVAAISPTTQDFTVNPTPGTDTKTFTITNTGIGTLTVGTPTLTGSAWFTLGTQHLHGGPRPQRHVHHRGHVHGQCDGRQERDAPRPVRRLQRRGHRGAARHRQAPPVATAQLTPSSRDYGNVLVGQTQDPDLHPHERRAPPT